MSVISTRAVQDNAGCVFVGHHFAKTSSWCADDLCVGVAWNEDRSTPFSTQDVVGPSHPVSCVEARDFITLEFPPQDASRFNIRELVAHLMNDLENIIGPRITTFLAV
jgi:hypothetical protein